MDKIIIIAGPTGVGKTELSIQLAKELDGEIVSADSMQIYQQLDIGTAKISYAEMQGVPHHMIDIIKPTEKFSVYDYKEHAEKTIRSIMTRGKIPIVVGGTGLYINSLIYRMDFNDASIDLEYRNFLWQFHKENGTEALYKKLTEVCPETKIEKENTKRIIRALEIFKEKGEIQQFSEMEARDDLFAELYVINRDRAELYNNINERVDRMIETGLVEEVQKLYESGLTDELQSMKAIGYLQIIRCLKGEYSLDEAIDLIKQESRRYAKRQITWFKRYKQAVWFNLSNTEKNEIINKIKYKYM